jgi:hypothetical protein
MELMGQNPFCVFPVPSIAYELTFRKVTVLLRKVPVGGSANFVPGKDRMRSP